MTYTANLYDELSRRLFGFDRNIIKRVVMMHCYSADDIDPWLLHLIKTEIAALDRIVPRTVDKGERV